MPETLSFTQKFPSPMIYKNGLLQLKWTRSKNYLDYIISIKSLDTTDAFLIPKDFNRPNSAEVKNLSQQILFLIFSEKRIQYSVVLFNYYGRQVVSILAVDENYKNYLMQLNSGGTDLKEISYKLNGAIGVFGSAAIDTFSVNLLKKINAK